MSKLSPQELEIAFKAMLLREFPAHSRLSQKLDAMTDGKQTIVVDSNFATELEDEIFKALKDFARAL